MQRNDVLHAIRAIGLDPADFEWSESVTQVTQVGAGRPPFTIEVLTHAPTGYMFEFDFEATHEQHRATFRPGPEGAETRRNPGSWEGQFGYLRGWLERVKAEYEAPDLWAEAVRSKKMAAPAEDVENTPFSPDERKLISQQLAELKELLVKAHGVRGPALSELEARVEYLEGATKRLGRVDWKQILYAELVGLVARAVIPEGAFQEAIRFLGRGIGHLFGGAVPELPTSF